MRSMPAIFADRVCGHLLKRPAAHARPGCDPATTHATNAHRKDYARHCCIERSGCPRWGQAGDFRAERPPRKPESVPKWARAACRRSSGGATSPQCNSAVLRTRRHGGGWPRRTHRDHLCCVCFTWRLLWRGWQPVPRSDLERSVSANSRSSRGHSLERGTPLSVAPSSLMLLVARLICRARSPTR